MELFYWINAGIITASLVFRAGYEVGKRAKRQALKDKEKK